MSQRSQDIFTAAVVIMNVFFIFGILRVLWKSGQLRYERGGWYARKKISSSLGKSDNAAYYGYIRQYHGFCSGFRLSVQQQRDPSPEHEYPRWARKSRGRSASWLRFGSNLLLYLFHLLSLSDILLHKAVHVLSHKKALNYVLPALPTSWVTEFWTQVYGSVTFWVWDVYWRKLVKSKKYVKRTWQKM